jgi:hypothetical protein
MSYAGDDFGDDERRGPAEASSDVTMADTRPDATAASSVQVQSDRPRQPFDGTTGLSVVDTDDVVQIPAYVYRAMNNLAEMFDDGLSANDRFRIRNGRRDAVFISRQHAPCREFVYFLFPPEVQQLPGEHDHARYRHNISWRTHEYGYTTELTTIGCIEKDQSFSQKQINRMRMADILSLKPRIVYFWVGPPNTDRWCVDRMLDIDERLSCTSRNRLVFLSDDEYVTEASVASGKTSMLLELLDEAVKLSTYDIDFAVGSLSYLIDYKTLANILEKSRIKRLAVTHTIYTTAVRGPVQSLVTAIAANRHITDFGIIASRNGTDVSAEACNVIGRYIATCKTLDTIRLMPGNTSQIYSIVNALYLNGGIRALHLLRCRNAFHARHAAACCAAFVAHSTTLTSLSMPYHPRLEYMEDALYAVENSRNLSRVALTGLGCSSSELGVPERIDSICRMMATMPHVEELLLINMWLYDTTQHAARLAKLILAHNNVSWLQMDLDCHPDALPRGISKEGGVAATRELGAAFPYSRVVPYVRESRWKGFYPTPGVETDMDARVANRTGGGNHSQSTIFSAITSFVNPRKRGTM